MSDFESISAGPTGSDTNSPTNEGIRTPSEQKDPKTRIEELEQKVASLETLVESQNNELINLRDLVSTGLIEAAKIFNNNVNQRDIADVFGHFGAKIRDQNTKKQ